nr:squamosa promoter-binding protein 1 [Ipomoea trifida]GMD03023.1 squamosa promoter-binding protein 1 [Ipomoea batatas]GMD11493.1 squamosa promoter-binding protein 1 [Ipomoea batatas]
METSKPEGKRSINETESAEGGEDEDEDVEEDNKKKRALTLSGRKLTGGGSTQLFCQVEDCSTDMTDAKPYHRRHKVCEIHAKAPSVLINGVQQRFCQQCSRFHELAQFDEAKRSCRRRLAGHNERRRRITYDSHGEGST